MIKKTMRNIGLLVITGLVVGCANKITPLPQNGPSSAEIWGGSGTSSNLSSRPKYFESNGVQIIPQNAMSEQTYREVQALNQDFRRIPNPQIIGYVAPHFGSNDMPIPGYFTTFMLYKTDRFTLSEEGVPAQGH